MRQKLLDKKQERKKVPTTVKLTFSMLQYWLQTGLNATLTHQVRAWNKSRRLLLCVGGISETTSGNRHRIKHPSFQFTIDDLRLQRAEDGGQAESIPIPRWVGIFAMLRDRDLRYASKSGLTLRSSFRFPICDLRCTILSGGPSTSSG